MLLASCRSNIPALLFGFALKPNGIWVSQKKDVCWKFSIKLKKRAFCLGNTFYWMCPLSPSYHISLRFFHFPWDESNRRVYTNIQNICICTYMDQAYSLVLLLFELNLDLDPDKVCSIYCYAASKPKITRIFFRFLFCMINLND